jgi:adenylate cyclase
VAASRRLAAIMFTDMVGFTQRTQTDERSSLRRLTEQENLVRPVIAGHDGRIVKSTGDGLLAEFPSALKATECAVAIQQTLRDRNLRSGGTPIELRIGIHLGDVEQRGEDIFGDAVNLAARVQPTAEAGGIAVSQQVFDQVANKLTLRFERLPFQPLKGVQAPMAIFRVVLPWKAAQGPTIDGSPGVDRLAVLPFANISPDPRDAYFSDGLTEEVIAVLSELKDLRVIARTSVDPYKVTPRPISQVAQELGVRWVLEGSVRKDGQRLRFTAQLIDAQTQEHLWSGKYDRELVDIFALQSELARQIADALKIRLLSAESERLDRRRAPNPESYLEYLQGRSCLRDLTQPSLRKAKGHYERALELDESNASAYAGLAEVVGLLASVYQATSLEAAAEEARRLAARALELDPDSAEAHTMLASNFADRYDFPAALVEVQRAIALNPSNAQAHLYCGAILADLNRPEEALREYALAEQLDPLSPLVLSEWVILQTFLGDFDAARKNLDKLGEVEKHGILYHDRRGQLALTTGDLDGFLSSVKWFEEQYAGRPEIRVAYAIYEARVGHPERAKALLAPVESLPELVRPTGGIPIAYAMFGDLDETFRWIDQAIAESRFSPRGWLYDPLRETVRADPRFSEILRRMHIVR